jgi:hypothetical protein
MFDSRDYPATGFPSADSISYLRLSSNTLRGTLKKSGKMTADLVIVVSKNGKITLTYPDYSQAKPAKSTWVYDKQ